ncbi:MAG: transposase [Bacteroidales bacterium]|nr:transposase [Bacteroidales bacterium]
MQNILPLEPGCFYHIYTHGVGGRNVFAEPENYRYFLALYDKYIPQVADTFAWALMPNHFHLLIRIKIPTIPDRVSNPVRDSTSPNPSNQFSKLLNAYAQAYNKFTGQWGALFQRPFKRKRIDDESHLKRVLVYIHNNPVHHDFCSHTLEYPWTSYLNCLKTDCPENTIRKEILDWFGGADAYKTYHDQKLPELIFGIEIEIE